MDNRFLVDTLSFAVPVFSVEQLFKELGLEIADFCFGRAHVQNYDYTYYYQGIQISYKDFDKFCVKNSSIFNGKNMTFEDLENMFNKFDEEAKYRCYVHMSGKGCRAYEDIQKRNPDFSWLTFLQRWKNFGCSFRRIDIAYDDKDSKLVTVRKCVEYYEKRKIAGDCRTFQYTLGTQEECFYCGSVKSKTLLRIYDKKMERGYAPDDLEGKPWLRCELQLRDSNAVELINKWIETGGLGVVFCGYVMQFVRFLVSPNDGKNSQRIPVVGWWKKFLSNAVRVKFSSEPGSDYNLSKLNSFINNHCASSIKTYLLSSNISAEAFYKSITSPEVKINREQFELLKRLGFYEGKYSDNFKDDNYLRSYYDNYADLLSAERV